MSDTNTTKKIWGLYCPASYKPETVEEMSEIDVWKAIDNIGAYLFWDMHDSNKPWRQNMSTEDRINAQYVIEFLVYHTRKYGVQFSEEPTEEKHVERSRSYNAWYLFWKNHFDNMPDEQYEEFVKDKQAGKDIAKYLPAKCWQESYQEQEKNNVLTRKLTNDSNTKANN